MSGLELMHQTDQSSSTTIMSKAPEQRQQPWKRWYTPIDELTTDITLCIMPIFLAGNGAGTSGSGSGNGSGSGSGSGSGGGKGNGHHADEIQVVYNEGNTEAKITT